MNHALTKSDSNNAGSNNVLPTDASGTAVPPNPAPAAASKGRRWRWVIAAGAASVLSWVALGVGITLDVDTRTMIVLATLAAVTTEGTVWLAALTLGVSTYQARRQIWQRLRGRFG